LGQEELVPFLAGLWLALEGHQELQTQARQHYFWLEPNLEELLVKMVEPLLQQPELEALQIVTPEGQQISRALEVQEVDLQMHQPEAVLVVVYLLHHKHLMAATAPQILLLTHFLLGVVVLLSQMERMQRRQQLGQPQV
jgi:hypothetical protein